MKKLLKIILVLTLILFAFTMVCAGGSAEKKPKKEGIIIGFSNASIMPAMSLGQLPEVFAMGLLGFFLVRLGQKRVMAIGVIMELARFISFSIGKPKLLVLTGIGFHGIAFAFFFSTAYIYLDNHCTKESRSGVHQLYAIITSGIGSFIGSLAAGKTLDFFTLKNNTIDFQSYWMVPAALSLITLLLLLLFFRNVEIQEG